MISQQAIDQFLKRQLSSYDWIKACAAMELDGEMHRLVPPPDFNGIEPWRHQRACFLLLLELKRFMLFLDMGAGKTLISLMLLKYRKQRGEHPRAIVFVPYITSVETWVEEVSKHCPSLQVQALLGTTADNLAALSKPADLYVICYQSAVAMLCFKDKKLTKWSLDQQLLKKTFAGFDTIICDEIHRCKSHSSLTYKMCRAISAQCEYALGLTGTPFGKDLQDLWPQFNLIDFGETLGPTLGIYRGAFFTQKLNYWGGFEYNFKPKMLPTLKRVIKNRSISYTLDEFTDMPPKEYFKRHLEVPAESRGYIDAAIKELKEGVRHNNYQLVNNSFLQLRQLSSGFMTLKGEDNDKVQVQFKQNPKLEALVGLLEDVPVGSKVVILHHFVFSNNVLSLKLKELGIKHARIWGGQRDPIGELRRFKNDPNCTVLVLNWRSGSASLNLQGANYMLIYEQPDSPIDRKQGEARLWRPGQTQRVLIYDLLVKHTADVRLHQSNEAGKSLLEELLNGRDLW